MTHLKIYDELVTDQMRDLYCRKHGFLRSEIEAAIQRKKQILLTIQQDKVPLNPQQQGE